MKRSTFEPENPDPVQEALGDLLHWSWSTRLQIARLRRSLAAEFKAWGFRQGVRKRQRFSTTSYDEHILLVAAANLDRALRKAPKSIRKAATLPEATSRALWLLRNIYEHWDELRRLYRQGSGQLQGAALKLKAEFPKTDPWSFTFNAATREIVLADVVPLEPFHSELRALERRLLLMERQMSRVKAQPTSKRSQ